MTNGIVARMIAGAICGAGLGILFGYAGTGGPIPFLSWLNPETTVAFGLLGAIIGASFVFALTHKDKP